jgi:hypothetical protein
MYKSTLCLALLSSIPLSAQAFSVESITITGGTLSITDPFGMPLSETMALTPGPAATVSDGLLNGVIDADGQHGSVSNPVVSTPFFGQTVAGYFAHSALACDGCGSEALLHDPDPDAISMNGSPWDPVITADFSGFFVDFQGNRILQGGTATGWGSWIAIPVVEGGEGLFSFELSWSSLVLEGPFAGMTGHWMLTGTAVTAVPEAETYALMLAGLGLVGVAARRRLKLAA